MYCTYIHTTGFCLGNRLSAVQLPSTGLSNSRRSRISLDEFSPPVAPRQCVHPSPRFNTKVYPACMYSTGVSRNVALMHGRTVLINFLKLWCVGKVERQGKFDMSSNLRTTIKDMTYKVSVLMTGTCIRHCDA